MNRGPDPVADYLRTQNEALRKLDEIDARRARNEITLEQAQHEIGVVMDELGRVSPGQHEAITKHWAKQRRTLLITAIVLLVLVPVVVWQLARRGWLP